MSENNQCTLCGAEEEELTPFGETMLCENCLSNETTICDHCGGRTWNEDTESDDNLTICRHCYEDFYCNCMDCHILIHVDRAYYTDDDDDYRDSPYCYQCIGRHEDSSSFIKSYNYKPSPVFYGEGVFYGVELELDEGGESSCNAEKILNIANKEDELIYCKHDGSFNDGFEIVTHPMSLVYHQNNMP